MWPELKNPLEASLVQMLEPLVNWYLPSQIESLKFTNFQLGNTPAHICGMAASELDGEVQLEMTVQFVAHEDQISVAVKCKGMGSPTTVRH